MAEYDLLPPVEPQPPGDEVFAPAVPDLPSPVAPITQDEFLSLLERLYPASYVEPLKDPGPGWEVFQAYAKVGARISTAISRAASGLLLLSAQGGTKAKVDVEFFRSNAAAGAVVVKAGTLLRCSKSGRQFLTLQDGTFGASDVGPLTVPAESRYPGFQYNVPGQFVAADGAILSGEIDTVQRPVQDPPFGDPTIRVRQRVAATGGVTPLLDLLGKDRGLPRHTGESDDAYRIRLRTLFDTVSPGAIVRAIAAVLEPYGVAGTFVELWQTQVAMVWNAPTTSPGAFAWNDPRPRTDLRNRWLSETTSRAAFAVVLPTMAAFAWQGFILNDPALTPAARRTAHGQRAPAAWNVPSSFRAGLLGAPNGQDWSLLALRQGLAALLRRIKAGGVTALVAVEGA